MKYYDNKKYYPNIKREMKFIEAWAKIEKLCNEESSLMLSASGDSKIVFSVEFLAKLKDLFSDIFSAPSYIPCFDPDDMSIKDDDLVALIDSATGEIKVLPFGVTQKMWRS